jgi:STE24 endopeptidase
MHLHVVLAFALLIWWTREKPINPLLTSNPSVLVSLLSITALVWLGGKLVSHLALHSLNHTDDNGTKAQNRYHRGTSLLRLFVLASFVFILTMTRWSDTVTETTPTQFVPALSELLIIAPFLAWSVIALITTYRVDEALRQRVCDAMTLLGTAIHANWTLRDYLNFNIRHQLLTVVVPMTVILLIYDASQMYESKIQAVLPFPWISDTALGLASAVVFVIAPWMLKRIWTTQPLEPSHLRDKLESVCRKINMHYQDILIWKSGSMVVNAAVMGLFKPVRYVMLSDGLLESMSDKQIQAVFGHEAGHIQHKHIPFFLLFALVSMLIAAAVMEIVYQTTGGPRNESTAGIQVIGFATLIAVWGFGFGFISRKFERQADLFGARCVTPTDNQSCQQPCSLHDHQPDQPHDTSPDRPDQSHDHPDQPRDTSPDRTDPPHNPSRLCATGVDVFTSALDRVALLNGIPLEEPSWRHSSIASRIEFLHALAGDPTLVTRFETLIRRIKTALITISVVGLAATAYYSWPMIVSQAARIRDSAP